DHHGIGLVDDLAGHVLQDRAGQRARGPVGVALFVLDVLGVVEVGVIEVGVIEVGVVEVVDVGVLGVAHLAPTPAPLNCSQAPEILRSFSTVSVGWAPWASHFTALSLSMLMREGSDRGS